MLTEDIAIAFIFVLAVISLICVLFTKKKALFGIITIGLFVFFYLDNNTYNVADNLTLLTFIMGITLLSLELFIPSFGLIGVAGLALIGYSVMDSYSDPGLGLMIILTTSIAVVLTVTVFVKLGFRVDLFDNSILKAPVRRVKVSKKTTYENLLGKSARSYTILRPAGRIIIDGKLYDAQTDAEFIKKDRQVLVTEIKEGRIIVKEI